MTPPTSPETADIETIAGRLEALAVRCEAATGPDREIDGRIWCALNGHRFVRFIRHDERIAWGEVDGSLSRSIMSAGMVFEHGSGGDRRNSRFQQFTTSPSYTASIDAAMTLVPVDGSMQFAEFSWSWEPSQPKVWPAASVRWYPPHKSGPDWHAFVVSARTPALTLCAAALRARAAHLRSGDPQ